ncbi:cytidylyltransferase domain-containing protein [Pseudothauera rhizosphaerae]|uniref:Acylneuraminate cytidylyltransferase n=1 Tax=Pseudothauera rhizosphaerae TaxID=2565932 RepID=A0A4S4AEY8_9RHOO|nr:glycosyltransferase family protein [Pseudothauera rhizosphaerae]THF57633.1 acylneuraminate cytidylyltransferase [Pseudothauera rhizosphaerae]
MSVGAVVQARMGSTRLPGKVLRDIAGRPLLAHVLDRLGHLRHRVVIVVATSTEVQDDEIARWCHSQGVVTFRGSETDVLDRYWRCAEQFGFEHVVRLTADNPFTDIEELDRLLDLHLSGCYDYSHSFGQMPLGVGAEIFSRAALAKSHAEGHKPNHREHVNEYIEEMPEAFRIGRLVVPAAKVAPALRLTVDTLDDWQRACQLANASLGRPLETEEAIRLCSQSV